MSSVRIDLHIDAFNAYRNDASVVGILESIADGIVSRATAQVTTNSDDGAPFTARTFHNPTRAVVLIDTSNFDGILAEATNRALTRAIG